MKILVCIKRVPDYQAKIKVKGDGSGIELDGMKWIINPFDEIAVEEAVRMKEKGIATEVVVASIGSSDNSQQLVYAMALGADRSILVRHEGSDSYVAARIFQKVYERENPGLVIMGKQGIDSDASQTAQILSTLISVPQICFVSELKLEDGKAVAVREVDGGLETVRVSLPAVVTTDLRLNEPRFATLPNQMKAKKKPLEEITIETLGLDATLLPRVKVRSLKAPAVRQAGKKVNSVAELIRVLKEEAKVL